MKFKSGTATTAILTVMMLFLASCATVSRDKKDTAQQTDRIVNVLCYHRFEKMKANKAGKKKGDIYYIDNAGFERHMKFLKDNGYNVISMSAYVKYLDGLGDIPENPVVITIDDGYASAYTVAFPILKKYSFPATLYLYTNFFSNGRLALTADQVKEMCASGIEIGCHSRSHPVLTLKTRKSGKVRIAMNEIQYVNFLKDEIVKSRKTLQDMLGLQIDTFAYPYGVYSNVVEQVVREAGYKAAFSVCPSYNTKKTRRMALKRTTIYFNTSTDSLKRALEMKPLDVKTYYPLDGDIITERVPVISAQLTDDSGINTATVKFTMAKDAVKQSVYDPATRTLTYKYTVPMKRGTHIARVSAIGFDGTRHEFEWEYVIGRPTKMDLLLGEANNQAEEVTQEMMNKNTVENY
jgi:peptidoglycan/xylan/chitin deacetylase (PgdA/CDA1 family)